MFNAQPSNDAPITTTNGERKMGLMSRIFGGKLAVGNNANDGTTHNIDKNAALAQTSHDVVNPENARFHNIRSVPIVQRPQHFDIKTAQALQILAKQKYRTAGEAAKAYQALSTIERADALVQKAHRGYEGVVATKELEKLQANAKLAGKLHQLRPAYQEMHQQVETANIAATNAIASIRATYGS
jgi:hypothetical protein